MAPEPTVIEENSTLMKVLSCIPVIGILPFVIQDRSLALKISLASEAEVHRLVELITVKNQYKVIAGVRGLLNIALVVAGLAFGVLSTAGYFAIAFFILRLTGIINAFYENKGVIHILQTQGFKQGLVVR